ncbi:hypothetical protein DXB18_00485 [Clostridium sp. OM02-18AC]|nr:hypothetical protein DXB18_00485 [Clostridium sp. OM02-18AC]
MFHPILCYSHIKYDTTATFLFFILFLFRIRLLSRPAQTAFSRFSAFHGIAISALLYPHLHRNSFPDQRTDQFIIAQKKNVGKPAFFFRPFIYLFLFSHRMI